MYKLVRRSTSNDHLSSRHDYFAQSFEAQAHRDYYRYNGDHYNI